MSNYEKLRQEAINKAWIAEIGEENYKVVEPIIAKHDGTAFYEDLKHRKVLIDNLPFDKWESGYVRPKSLQGIEDNNGWTRIEPDGINLPEDNFVCDVFLENGTEYMGATYFQSMKLFARNAIQIKGVTHYRPIEKHKPPII